MVDHADEQASITCPVCGRTSYNDHDIEAGYCSKCQWWTSDPILAPLRPRVVGNPIEPIAGLTKEEGDAFLEALDE